MKLSLKRALNENANFAEFILDTDDMQAVPGYGLANMGGPAFEEEDEGCGGTGDCGCSACEAAHEHEEDEMDDHHMHRDRHAAGGDELDMVLSNLQELVNDCTDLLKMMKNSKDVEEWVQEKIATSQDRIHAVHGYMKYKNHKPDDDSRHAMLVVRRT
jgi:hypothetical protein